jgi:DNA-binding CsgD family transcriptional regulator
MGTSSILREGWDGGAAKSVSSKQGNEISVPLFKTRKPHLTPRELVCLHHVAEGFTDREIATLLSISTTTVKFHLVGARKKLGARSRAHAISRLVFFELYHPRQSAPSSK